MAFETLQGLCYMIPRLKQAGTCLAFIGLIDILIVIYGMWKPDNVPPLTSSLWCFSLHPSHCCVLTCSYYKVRPPVIVYCYLSAAEC